MTTTQLDTLTDYLAKTNSTMFPIAEKLLYYNIGYGIIYGLIMDEKEDNYEEENTTPLVAGQNDYSAPQRLHNTKWLKIDYGDGFVPATETSEQDLILQYGDQLESRLSTWDAANPIYWHKGDHYFIYPTPTAAQALTGQIRVSVELLPADLTASDTPDLPENFHNLLSHYAAFQYHDNNGEDTQAQKRKRSFDEGVVMMIKTMFPRNRQEEMEAHIPDDDGSDY